jgi:hypothetical protein
MVVPEYCTPDSVSRNLTLLPKRKKSPYFAKYRLVVSQLIKKVIELAICVLRKNLQTPSTTYLDRHEKNVYGSIYFVRGGMLRKMPDFADKCHVSYIYLSHFQTITLFLLGILYPSLIFAVQCTVHKTSKLTLTLLLLLSLDYFLCKNNIFNCSDLGGNVPDSKSRNIPEVVLVGRWAIGVLGSWKGWDSWVKGGANGVSLQAT